MEIASATLGLEGAGGSYLVESVFLLVALWLTWRMDLPSLPPDRTRQSAWQDSVDGLRYIRASATLMPLLLISAIPVVLALPFTSMMPVVARDDLHVGPEGLGLLMASNGAGAVVGSVLLAVRNPAQRGRLMVGGALAMCVLLLIFTFSRAFWLSVAMLALVGVAHAIYQALNQTLLHLTVDDHMRGRLMGVYQATWALLALGSLPVGALAGFIGAPGAIAVSSSLCLVALVLTALRWRMLTRL